MNCAIDQILRLAPSMRPDIEPVVSRAKTSSTRGATLGTCTWIGGLTFVTTGSFVGRVVPRCRGIAGAAHAASTNTPLKSPYVTSLRFSMTVPPLRLQRARCGEGSSGGEKAGRTGWDEGGRGRAKSRAGRGQ